MTALVLDTGALIALDRNDRTVWAMLRNASVALVAAARAQTGPAALVTSGPTDLRHLLQTLNASVRLVTI